jgi:hypothetical protein
MNNTRRMPKLSKLSAGNYETVIDGETYLVCKYHDGWLWRNANNPSDSSEWKLSKQLCILNLFHHTNAIAAMTDEQRRLRIEGKF